MEVKLNIGYEQLIAIINQLPADEVSKLKTEIERILSESDREADDDLERLIVDGPIMSDEQYQAFEENRNHFKRMNRLSVIPDNVSK